MPASVSKFFRRAASRKKLARRALWVRLPQYVPSALRVRLPQYVPRAQWVRLPQNVPRALWGRLP